MTRSAGMLLVGVLCMMVQPTRSDSFQYGIAKQADGIAEKAAVWVEANAGPYCAKMGAELGPCIAGMAAAGAAAEIFITCYNLHGVAQAARQNYGYFETDVTDMKAYLDQMAVYVPKVWQGLRNSTLESVRTAGALTIEVSSNAKAFLGAVQSALKHEEDVAKPTTSMFWGAWCWLAGCPHTTKEIDDELRELRRWTTELLPDLDTLQALALRGSGPDTMLSICHSIKSNLGKIQQSMRKLKEAMESDTSGANTSGAMLLDTASLWANDTELLEVLRKMDGEQDTNFATLLNRATLLKAHIQVEQSWIGARGFYTAGTAWLLFILMVSILIVRICARQSRGDGQLSAALLRDLERHGDRVAAAVSSWRPASGGHDEQCQKACTGGIFIHFAWAAVVCLACYSTWCSAAHAQLRNEVASIDRLTELTRAMAADTAAVKAVCAINCSTDDLLPLMGTASAHGALAFNIVMDSASEALSTLEL